MGADESYQHVADVIRAHRDEILRLWKEAVQALPRARDLDEPRLVDHIPDLLDRIAGLTERARGSAPDLPRYVSEQHAIARLEEGFDILEVIGEFRALRQAIFRTFADPRLAGVDLDAIRTLDDAIDTAISDSVDRYSQVRDRTLQGLDRVASAALESHDLDDLLTRLLRVMHDATPAIDVSALYLRDRDVLRLRAAVGISEDVAHRFADAFAEAVAVRAEPMTRHEPAEESTLRVLYGVPIVAGEDVIGIAAIGSHRADDFSLADRRMFGAMVARASAAILQHVLRDQAQQAATTRRFLDEATKLLNCSLDYHATLDDLAHLVVPELADFCIVDLLEGGKLQHVAMVHADPDKLAVARELVAQSSYDPSQHLGTRQILARGAPLVTPSITDDMVLARSLETERELRRRLEMRSWIGAPLVARGQTIGVIHLLICGSRRGYSESDLDFVAELGRRAGAAVDNARLYRDAQDAIRIRDDVLAIVSHDLRNPLSTIDLGATLLLQRFGNDVRARKHLDAIRRSAERMEHLIKDLLDMASINVGKLAMTLAPVELSELYREAVDTHEPVALERSITLIRDCDVPGVHVNVDRNRMLQVFANVIGNALKFCTPGDAIMIRCSRDHDVVHVVVADSGPGIPADDLPHIFEPYWSGRGKKKGTGLGLFITKAIVEAHSGRIAVTSEEGKGATFTVTLPIST